MWRRAVIGIDTNVLVRYLVQDDPEQSALAETGKANGASATASFDHNALKHRLFMALTVK